LAVELPARLDRISQAIETGGLEVHVRAAQVEAVAARTERLANRVAASVLAAAVINGLVQLEAQRRRHRSPLPWSKKNATGNLRGSARRATARSGTSERVRLPSR
jgi:hypothetical protein